MNRLTKVIISLCRRLPFKTLERFLVKIYTLYKSFKKIRTVIATIDGITYELDLDELMDSVIYFEGSFEPDTTGVINKLCKEGMTVIDIGANIGCHTLRFAKLVGPRGKVIAFEPMSWAFSKLIRNIELNNFDNIVLEKTALSNENNENQEVNFPCSWPISGIVDFKRYLAHQAHIMKDVVDFITLDDYVSKKGMSKIDLIKLDVDGYEFKVIRGALETLKLYNPIIIMELAVYTLKEMGDKVTDLVSLLSDLGYKFYSEKDMKRFPSTDIMINSIPKEASINVVLRMDAL
jgi:FkbM family methyltransferase